VGEGEGATPLRRRSMGGAGATPVLVLAIDFLLSNNSICSFNQMSATGLI
jgi:hypothetical protein